MRQTTKNSMGHFTKPAERKKSCQKDFSDICTVYCTIPGCLKPLAGGLPGQQLNLDETVVSYVIGKKDQSFCVQDTGKHVQ
jgi:hypothetical protein